MLSDKEVSTNTKQGKRIPEETNGTLGWTDKSREEITMERHIRKKIKRKAESNKKNNNTHHIYCGLCEKLVPHNSYSMALHYRACADTELRRLGKIPEEHTKETTPMPVPTPTHPYGFSPFAPFGLFPSPFNAMPASITNGLGNTTVQSNPQSFESVSKEKKSWKVANEEGGSPVNRNSSFQMCSSAM